MTKAFQLLLLMSTTILSLSWIGLSNSKCKLQFEKFGVSMNRNVEFDFTARFNDKSKESIEINAILQNKESDTIYFLSTTCEGLPNSIQCDTSIFHIGAIFGCNVSRPYIEKIPPHGEIKFKAFLYTKSMVSKIKLGYDFYMVNKEFKLQETDINKIHYRKENEKTIIWAKEMNIK